MSDSFVAKAGALVLTGAGVLGVAYGIAKYVADFETAKAEIQNLRGQITQLQTILAKSQEKPEGERIDRLEKQVAELVKARAPEPDKPAGKAKPAIAAHLAAGGFSGTASDGKDTWPFRATNLRLNADSQFEADVEWVTLGAVHKVRGNFSQSNLFFKEVSFVRKGNNVLGCEYSLNADAPNGMSGTYSNCDGNVSGGTISVTWW